jgi:LysR family transcriptional regulator, low CO2-responsive transcriptional regulator
MTVMSKTYTSAGPLDSRQLRILSMLIDDKSLSAIARKLHLTQSAISQALKRLEEDTDSVLVERSEKGAELTQAGQALARRAKIIMEQMTAAREELRKLKTWGTRTLRVGASNTACQYLLPPVMESFSKKHAKCRLEVMTGHSESRLNSLRQGEIDLVIITHSGLEAADLVLEHLFEEELCMVAPSNTELKQLPFISYQKGSNLSEDALRWFDAAGEPRPGSGMELQSLDGIKTLIGLGLGYSVLPKWVIGSNKKNLQIKSAASPLHRTWSLAMRKGHHPTMAETTWTQCCREQGRLLMRR